MADTANDIKAHVSTYAWFTSLLKWTVPIIAVIAFVVILLIS
ncbi:MAG: aa3-type cytochrome c oxidase subunit IV [Croceibacterium sp.]